MHLILVLVGTVLAFAGALLVLYAVPVIDVAAAALFISGIFAIVGALIVFALAVLARGIDRIAERLELQPLSAPSMPSVVTVAREEAAPRTVRVEPPPAAAAAVPAEPAIRVAKRPSVLSSWLNRASPAVTAKKPPQVVTEAVTKVEALPPARVPDELPPPPPLVAHAPVEPTVTAPPIAAAPAPHPPPPAPPPPPPPPPAPPTAAPTPAAPIIPRAVTPAARPVPSAAPAPASPATTVYKSGVIDGMAYTLFMDGAIEAELPQGRVRFASVDELQRYLTSRG